MSTTKQEILVVGCLIWDNDKFLLLQRQSNKPEANKWGIPAGKVDPGEDEYQAILREVQEETGISLSPEEITPFHQGIWTVSNRSIRFHSYNAQLPNGHNISISKEEHASYCWNTKEEALSRTDLIHTEWFKEVFEC